jgi:uncharacterized protein (TIGR02452 family)
MIKRNGVELMSARTNNVSIAKETLAALKVKSYTTPSGNHIDISTKLDAAIVGTILYKDILPWKIYSEVVPTIEVFNETTSNAAARLKDLGKTNLVALNFASARNPGGGFLGGAIAQEEDLCRSSGLYPCVKSKPIFYNENILCDNTYYTDNVIYSPNVPFIRGEDLKFLEAPFELSIITAPAPNVRAIENLLTQEVRAVLLHRAIKILQIAEVHGHKNIILGAWGCGAFGNSPEMVATVFMGALKVVPTFEHVCFAVYDTKPGAPVFEEFKKQCHV